MPSKSSRAKTELKKTSKKTKKKKNKVEPCYQQKTSIGTYNEKTSQKQKKSPKYDFLANNKIDLRRKSQFWKLEAEKKTVRKFG